MKNLIKFAIGFCVIAIAFSCGNKTKKLELPAEKTGTFWDYTLDDEKRAGLIVSQLSLDEKISQMLHEAPAIPRLDIPSYNWWNECLHGVARAGIATVFPQAIGLAATWDSAHVHEVAKIISDEARAKHHEAIRNGERGIYQGLTMWSPNINIFRDPRWGRGQETYGEDPYLTSCMGIAFVKGLQGNHPDYLKLVATPKHYAVHSGPEPERHEFNALANDHDLWETYLPAFQATVEKADAYSVMCAYNRYEGEACCGSEFLLQDILRDQWEFNGYVVSDCGAVRDISEYHEVTGTDVEAAALAVKSGTDLNCGSKYKKLAQAVEKGYLTEKEIDMALKRLFLARIKLGMFDPPGMVPYAQIPIEVNDAPEHDNMALESARKSMVLLKNNGILPLKKDKLEKIAVIGPNADAVEVLLGNYNGTPSAPVTPLQGIKEAVGEHVEVIYEVGCNRAGDRMVLRQVPETFLSTNGQPGLQAEYFDNPELQGEPFHAQVDKTIQSNWDLTEIKGLNEEVFSIRWTGTLSVPKSGTYILGLTGDDGFRLYLNEVLLVEEWEKQAPETHTNEVELQAGKEYKLSIEFFQNGGGAMLEFKYAMKTENPYEMAIEAAKGSDAVLFFGGLSPHIEGEEMDVDLPGFRGGDRTEIDVPATQTELLKDLKQANENLVAVFLSGSALAMNWEQENIPAILQAWYPGQRGGTALADVLFGKYNPAGRLPVTYYKSAKDLPPFADYSMKNRTYKYFTGEPLYPFGFGLSYTSFEYTDMALEKTNFTKGEKVVLEVTIKNNGSMDGDEVVQLYLTDTKASFTPPKAALKRFTRIHLKAGEEKTLKFELPGEEFFGINEYGEKTFEPGQFMLTVGGSSPGKRSADLGAPEALTAKITIE